LLEADKWSLFPNEKSVLPLLKKVGLLHEIQSDARLILRIVYQS
jgi:hypothetical protein